MKRLIREEDQFFARVRNGQLECSHLMRLSEGLHR